MVLVSGPALGEAQEGLVTLMSIAPQVLCTYSAPVPPVQFSSPSQLKNMLMVAVFRALA